MVDVMTRDAASSDSLEFRVTRTRDDGERREELLEDIAVPLEQQSEELGGIVRHQVKLEAGFVPVDLDRLARFVQGQDLVSRQDVATAKIPVRVRRRGSVEMRSADGREEQRVRMIARRFAETLRVSHEALLNSSLRARTR
jgi:hypothetical protein